MGLCGSIRPQSFSHRPGEVLLQLSQGADIKEVLNSFEEHFPEIVPGKEKLISSRLRVWKLQVAAGAEEDAVRTILSLKGVSTAQLNHEVNRRGIIPDDPGFPDQWSLQNTGQNGGVPGADIKASDAWEISTGGLTVAGDTIVVAVIDEGFETDHPDLQANIFINRHEIPGNGIDDDNNGYTDDVSGWNAYTNSSTHRRSYHGNHVLGVIGAQADNAGGVAGINWNIKMLPVTGGPEDESIVLAAYNYVLEMKAAWLRSNGDSGAYIVATNSSFGIDRARPADFPLWCEFYDSLGAYGILNAAATANMHINVDQLGDMPTNCTSPWLIGVTSSDRFDTKYTGAAYGKNSIDIAAPGVQIYSTIHQGQYGFLTGTSHACPHVTGAIALMYAAANAELITLSKTHPAQCALLMKEAIMAGADTLVALLPYINGGLRLNLERAVKAVAGSTGENKISREVPLIYPQPASDEINIRFPESWEGYITSIEGQILRNIPLQHAGETILNLQNLSPGIYLIRIITGKGQYSQKILKM